MIPMLFKWVFFTKTLKLLPLSISLSPLVSWQALLVRPAAQPRVPTLQAVEARHQAFRDVALRWIQMPGPLTWWSATWRMHGCKEDVIAVMSCCLAPMICWQIFVGVGFLGGGFLGGFGGEWRPKRPVLAHGWNRRFVSMSCLSGKLFTGTSCEGRQHASDESSWEKHQRLYSPVWWSWTC